MKNKNAAKNVAKTAKIAQATATQAQTPVGAALANLETKETKMTNLTLTKTKSNKGGEVYYSFGAGSIRFGKSAFAEGATPPDSIVMEVPEGVFAPAGAVRVGGGGGGRAVTAEALAKAEALAQKQADRAKKAQLKLDKLKLRASKGKPVVEEAATEEAATV